MYKFQYLLNDNDYLEFNKFHLSTAPMNKKSVFFLRLMFPVVLTMLLLLSFLNSEKPFEITEMIIKLVIYALLSVAWILLVKPMLTAIMKKQIKNMKKHGKLPYGKDVTIEFYEDCFVETTQETETKVKYHSVERVAYSNQAIYIYISSMQAFILPLDVFESAEQGNSFNTFLNDKVAAK